MLHAIFYARFHPRRGPSVVHQYPPNALVSSDIDDALLPIDFGDISSYVIPPYDLCNRPLAVCSNDYRILGYPISLEDAKYDRNRFTFNICFVIDDQDDVRTWQPLVNKTAAFLRYIEEQDELLQAEEMLPGLRLADAVDYPACGVGVLYPLLESIHQDLNEYSDACVRLDETNVLNLRLFPLRPAAPAVHSWDVPLLIRSLPRPEEWTWDLTLLRIQPFIDGINYVQRIAALADVEVRLVKRAVRELVYHERARLLDIFHFQAIYTPTADFARFVTSTHVLDECREYVRIDSTTNPLHATHGTRPSSRAHNHHQEQTSDALLTREAIVMLYTHLSPGLPLSDFVLAHQAELGNVDVRRFITFGVVKGFLRRVHRYALALDGLSKEAAGIDATASQSSPSKTRYRLRDDTITRQLDRAWKKAALSSGWATPPSDASALTSTVGTPTQRGSLSKSAQSTAESRSAEDTQLRAYLDGPCHLDQIGVELGFSERVIVERLRSGRFGEVVLFCR